LAHAQIGLLRCDALGLIDTAIRGHLRCKVSSGNAWASEGRVDQSFLACLIQRVIPSKLLDRQSASDPLGLLKVGQECFFDLRINRAC
jgi:hypothetical protein